LNRQSKGVIEIPCSCINNRIEGVMFEVELLFI
jgi:hypothetical protein